MGGEKPTRHMKDFLNDLAVLFEDHGIEVEAVDDDAPYYPSVEGVEFYQNPNLEKEIDYCSVRLPRYFDAVDIRKLIEP